MTQEGSFLPPSGRAPERLPVDCAAFHEMQRPIYVRRAERVLRCRADAEDAVDEAFEKLVKQWPRVLRCENPAAYAWRVVSNTIIDHARARGRRATLMETAVFDTAAMRDAEDPIGELEQNMRLFGAMEALSERQRTVIELRYCEDFSTADTASTLGITAAGVRSIERYAKRRLREIYDGEINEAHGTEDGEER